MAVENAKHGYILVKIDLNDALVLHLFPPSLHSNGACFELVILQVDNNL